MTITTLSRTFPSTRTTSVRRTFSAEWTKLRSLPSTWRTVAIASVMGIGLGAAVAEAQVSSWKTMTSAQHAAFDPTSASMFGLLIVIVLIGALAVRTVTAEYTTGMIRTTFTAMPSRRGVLAAKAVAAAGVAFPVALVCDVVGFQIGQGILAAKHVQVTLGHPGVPAAIVFGAVAASLTAVIGVSLGGLIRRTAPATTLLSLVLIGGSLFGPALPAGFRQYLPETVAQATVTVHRSAGLLPAGTALGILALYAALLFVAASIRIGGRDA